MAYTRGTEGDRDHASPCIAPADRPSMQPAGRPDGWGWGWGWRGRRFDSDRGSCAVRPDRVQGQHLRARRSEEHTSELQSHSDLVCRLLLEKKKKNKKRLKFRKKKKHD